MNSNFEQKICVLGLGYIGLPTASLLATKGFSVLGVDTDAARVESINLGKLPIAEPGLEVLFQSAVQSSRLRAQNSPKASDIFIIAVPTPIRADKIADLSAVENAISSIVPLLAPENLIIIESTIPPGTTENILKLISDERPELNQENLYLAHSPERVLPSQILKELVENDRVVGGITPKAAEKAAEFYRSFVQGEVLITNTKTAELTKLVENSFRDVNIAFANELSLVCDDLGVSVWEVIKMANRHPRVEILKPGPGVGGHCIAVDPWFLAQASPENTRLIRTARETNDLKPKKVIEKIEAAAESQSNPCIAFLGLSYKANTDDTRESPAIEILQHFQKKTAYSSVVVEPHLEELPSAVASSSTKMLSLEAALELASIVVMLVDHREFLSLRTENLSNKIVIDTRGVLS